MMDLDTISDLWTTAPVRPRLGPNEVHVWRTTLDGSMPDFDWMEGILSPDERLKAGRFRLAQHRFQFVARHAALRMVLARYLDADPASLRFSFGPYGKPGLTDERRGDTLMFNVSHSRDLVLYAVTRGRQVGIDVEWCRRDVDEMGIAQNCFSTPEATLLRALAPEPRRSAFFALWTCKEAYLKAVGVGLSLPMHRVEVSLDDAHRPTLESIAASPAAAHRWSCMTLTPTADYVATLVAQGNDWTLSRRYALTL